MKKFLLSLIVGLSCVALQAQTVTETLTIDNFGVTQNSYKDVEYTSETTGITYKGNMAKAQAKDGSGMQFRTTTNKEAGFVATANPKGYEIVSVAVTVSSTSSNQWNVYGNDAAYNGFKDLYTDSKAGTLLGNGTKNGTLTPDTKFGFFGFRGNNGAIYISKIEITYELGGEVDTREECGLAFTAEEFTANIGAANDFPTLTNPNNLKVTYESEYPAVATVAADGTVTPLAEGTTKITATFAGDDTYKAGSVFYTLTVVDPNKPQPDATLNSDVFEDFTNQYKCYTYEKDGVTYKAKAYKNNGMQVNTSGSNTATASGIASVANTNNLIIKQIVVTANKKDFKVLMGNNPNSVKNENGELKDIAIEVDKDAVEIEKTAVGNTYVITPADNYKYFALQTTASVVFSSIEIYYKEKPAAPVIKDGDVEIAESIEFEGDSKVVYLDLPEGVNAYYKFEVAEEATPAEAPRRAAHTPAEGFTQYVHADGITLTDNGTLHVYTEKDGAVSETRKVAVTKTGDTTAIEAIEADTTAPVEYFNLQGIRVANPENGLYIRRQGGKAAKVLVKK